MKKIALLLVVLLGSGAIYYFRTLEGRNAPEPDAAYYSGNLELRRVNLSFRVGGKLSTFTVEEGARVSRGDRLAALDAEPLAAEVAIARASRDEARAVLECLENGARRQELEEAKALVREYEANLARATSEVARNEKLLQTRAVSESAYEISIETRDVFESRLARSREALSLLEEGTRREELDAARATLARAEATLQKAEIALQDATLVAPNDGILLTRVAEPGAIVALGQTVATLSLRDSVWAYVYLVERDLGRIAQGARAEIRTDSSSRVYEGRVGYISPEAEFTPKTVETKELRTNLVYRARIIVDDPDDGLRQGAPVDVKIEYVHAQGSNELETAPGAEESSR
ncbi:MAG: efflux RND transporter periplasmic adaptor subunit [Thermoguttaceae bacterium]|nr:efflux RND transporter periplasmic adaptor subunit [Thermoguttaceae bacterium]